MADRHVDADVGPQRVMPTSFFVLARFWLRVDGVLFRIFDTRLYHSFSSSPPLIVRETSGWEAPYKTIKAVRFRSIKGWRGL